MKIDSTRKEVEKKLAFKIRETMSEISFPFEIVSEEWGFDIIKNTSFLIAELLSNKDTKNDFIKAASKSKANGKNNEIWIESFEVIRDIIAHFPFFDSWDDIYLNRVLLNWNNKNLKNKKHIESFFDKYAGKEIGYDIYTHNGENWIVTHTAVMHIPKLKVYKKIYLKDIISFSDVIWTFCIIDYYISFMNFDVLTFSSVSM